MKQIRSARERDLSEVTRIFGIAISTADWLPESARKNSTFNRPHDHDDIFVCHIGFEIAGFMTVCKPESYIHHLFVDSRFQRLGVGKTLLNSLENSLPMPWQLKCANANRSALMFYSAMGWRLIGSGGDRNGKYTTLEYRGLVRTRT